jgi:hypothetical protein
MFLKCRSVIVSIIRVGDMTVVDLNTHRELAGIRKAIAAVEVRIESCHALYVNGDLPLVALLAAVEAALKICTNLFTEAQKIDAGAEVTRRAWQASLSFGRQLSVLITLREASRASA